MNNDNLNKLRNSLCAGFVAITVNTILLKAASLFLIAAESGGLLKLIILHAKQYLPSNVLLLTKTTGFWLLFHYMTGFAMVLIYLYVFEKMLPGKGWVKGSLFSLVPWIINGCIVLPLLGQGFAGIQALPLSGIIYFFITNLIFGLTLGVLYERFTK